MSLKLQPKVEVGQLWQDMDKRMGSRTVTVEHIEGEHAICRIGDGKRKTRLLLRRMRPGSTGWRLIRDADGKRVEE